MRIAVALMFLLCGSAQAADLKNTAFGIFSLTKINDPDLATDKSWTNPNIRGVVIRTRWEFVEPKNPNAKGVTNPFDWDYIDKGVALAEKNNKQVAITVVAGQRSPTWIYSAGAKKFIIHGVGVMPCPWDSTFQSYWQQFVTAFGARYDSNSSVAYITAEGPGRTEECYLCKSQADVAELNADGGVGVWITAAETIAQFYYAAFPTTPFVYADGEPIPGDTADYGTVVQYCVGAYGANFGIKSDGLDWNYHSTFGEKEIPALSPDHPVGFQDLKTFSDPTKLQESLNIGIELKGHFIEVYTRDVTANDDQSILAAAESALLNN
jgi:hypothetical protein